ncbi:MAG: DNA polymerase III subunit delta [Bryobacter sp.]|nr:DNA polymerase III subunit delta [Bryobacter sp.]
MTPAQFLGGIAKKAPPPVLLFLGPDLYDRDRCRRALLEKVLPPEERGEGYVRHDLSEVSLANVIDDAGAMSLFANRRLIWCASAEAALPRRLTEDAEEKDGGLQALRAYLANPSPDVTLVFDVNRYHFEGDDKAKVDRVRKFYADIQAVVEFPHYTEDAARDLAAQLAAEGALRLGRAELDLIVEALGANATRIATELEKLRLFKKPGDAVTSADIERMIPDARATNIFALVNALGRGDRMTSLDLLETLTREGEYLPLALSFLGTQFRLGLAAAEAGLRGSGAVQAHFSKLGVPMWKARADQVAQTAAHFSKSRLEAAIAAVYEADKALRDTRPDDQVVMERLVWKLTA